MKNKLVMLLVVFVSSFQNAGAQLSFLGFNHPICASPMTEVYSYYNYSSSHGGGYVISHNGTTVDSGFNQWGAVSCVDLIFINDSTGFSVVASGWGTGISKTSNYGEDWIQVGFVGPYLGLYIIDANYGYVVYYHSNSTVLVNSISDIITPSTIIYDSTLDDDIYIIDSLPNCVTCNVDSLNMTVANNTDTATYHIVFKCRNIGLESIEFKENSLEIYPNPGTGKFNITVPDDLLHEQKLSLNVYDYTGQLIKKAILVMPGDRIVLDLEEEAKGIYHIIINSDAKSYCSKILSQ